MSNDPEVSYDQSSNEISVDISSEGTFEILFEIGMKRTTNTIPQVYQVKH